MSCKFSLQLDLNKLVDLAQLNLIQVMLVLNQNQVIQFYSVNKFENPLFLRTKGCQNFQRLEF